MHVVYELNTLKFYFTQGCLYIKIYSYFNKNQIFKYIFSIVLFHRTLIIIVFVVVIIIIIIKTYCCTMK